MFLALCQQFPRSEQTNWKSETHFTFIKNCCKSKPKKKRFHNRWSNKNVICTVANWVLRGSVDGGLYMDVDVDNSKWCIQITQILLLPSGMPISYSCHSLKTTTTTTTSTPPHFIAVDSSNKHFRFPYPFSIWTVFSRNSTHFCCQTHCQRYTRYHHNYFHFDIKLSVCLTHRGLSHTTKRDSPTATAKKINDSRFSNTREYTLMMMMMLWGIPISTTL